MIDVAILGSGFMGAAHASNYKALRDRVRVKTIWSRSYERAERLAREVGATPTTDLRVAVMDSGVDVVDICLPTHLHRETAQRALAENKHVLLEKPIALNQHDADVILEAAEKSSGLFMVDLTLRFWPEYVELQRRVAAGDLGRPVAVSTQRLSPPADWNDWMINPDLSGGVTVDLLVHDFDQMNGLLGQPRSVFARAPRADHVLAIVEYDDAHGIAEGSMLMPELYPFSSSIRVLCEDGVAEYAFRASAPEDGGNIGEVDATVQGLKLHHPGGMTEIVASDEPAPNPWWPMIVYFLECVEQNRVPQRGTGQQASEALRISLAANRSIESGRPEHV